MGSNYIAASKWNTNQFNPENPWRRTETKYFTKHRKQSIAPGRGLSKQEVKDLPKGITVIEETRDRNLSSPRKLTKRENHLRQVALAKATAKKKRIRALSKLAPRSQRK